MLLLSGITSRARLRDAIDTISIINLIGSFIRDMHEFRKSGMAIQFGPDRFILNIDKNVTKIPHDNIRRIEHGVNGDVKILVVQTKTSLQAPSVLEPYYDPTPNSGKAKKIVLLSNANSDAITDCCKRLKKLNVDVRTLSPEATEKILLMSNKHTETKDASGSKGPEGSILSGHSTDSGNAKQNTTTRRADDTLFQFPFKGNARSKSISIRVEDMSRLKEGEFLNDTLIEFGLKHVHANLESRDSELAENTYIFNSFFYERLVSGSGKGIAYDAVKSWTNKIDLFSKKFIIIPIHEKPYILVLDSLGGQHPGVFKSLRAYLQQELQARKGTQRTIDPKDVPGKLANVFHEPFIGPLLDEIVNKKDGSSKYWTTDDLALKREKYREIMSSLAEEYKTFLQEQIKIKKANPGA
ncbi:hypothetical protein BGX34_009883 [Mortierella sp. NVP85]|nr:hypothetical protein BGX34_009883 [Mortierella sp. NVP85]